MKNTPSEVGLKELSILPEDNSTSKLRNNHKNVDFWIKAGEESSAVMSEAHHLRGPIFFNDKLCMTYEELRDIILDSTDGATSHLAQTFRNNYGSRPTFG